MNPDGVASRRVMGVGRSCHGMEGAGVHAQCLACVCVTSLMPMVMREKQCVDARRWGERGAKVRCGDRKRLGSDRTLVCRSEGCVAVATNSL